MKLPEENDTEPLTFFGLLDVLVDFERRLRTLEEHNSSAQKVKEDE